MCTYAAQPQPEPVGFDDVNLGDRIAFLTASNGFDGDGTLRERTGTVTGKTDKTVTVACETNQIGAGARLTRARWHERSVRRIEKAAKLPYRAGSVKIVDHGHAITALYIPDPEQAKDPQYVLDNLLDRSRYEAVEVIATARKFTKADGADFSGWIVEGGPNDFTDPLANKVAAMAALRDDVTRYFTTR